MIWKLLFVLLSLGVCTNFAMPVQAQTMLEPDLMRSLQAKQSNRNYVGLRYRTVPKGITDLGGWVIGDDRINGREYIVANVRRGTQQMLWLGVILSRDTQGRPTYQVVDVLNLPALSKSVQLTHGGQCERNGVVDPELVTIARYGDTAQLRQILQAWRTNRRSGRFEVVSVRNIVCSNRGGGI